MQLCNNLHLKLAVQYNAEPCSPFLQSIPNLQMTTWTSMNKTRNIIKGKSNTPMPFIIESTLESLRSQS